MTAMSKLKHTFKTDVLFKMLFTKYPGSLKQLTAHLLRIPVSSIGEFKVESPEMPPDGVGDKFCRLDILMTIDGQKVNLEIQVEDEGDFPERTLFYWARIYSNSLRTGKDYIHLPRTIIISILDFTLFKGHNEYHSEFQLLEVTRHHRLTDKMLLHFFELPKLPEIADKDNLLHLWLSLFKAETREDLKMIEDMGVTEINEIVTAYHKLAQSPEFREMERQREKTQMNEASALRNEREKTEKRLNKKWKGIVADKDAEIKKLRRQLADLNGV